MINHVIAALAALLAGMGVSAGTFAFILVIGVVPRIMQRMEYKNIVVVENIIILGVVLGNISSIFDVILYNANLHTFPILFKRFNLNKGLKIVIFSMAIGKVAGCIYYFLLGYAIM